MFFFIYNKWEIIPYQGQNSLLNIWEPSLPNGSERATIHQSYQGGFSVGKKFLAIFQPSSPINYSGSHCILKNIRATIKMGLGNKNQFFNT